MEQLKSKDLVCIQPCIVYFSLSAFSQGTEQSVLTTIKPQPPPTHPESISPLQSFLTQAALSLTLITVSYLFAVFIPLHSTKFSYPYSLFPSTLRLVSVGAKREKKNRGIFLKISTFVKRKTIFTAKILL
uniref:Transmembrane protein n=1 Tax=Cacopsylla melanoneura TaxID=428564 RepID=A0A8D8T051_9HEMI